jgi:hypothetical protein
MKAFLNITGFAPGHWLDESFGFFLECALVFLPNLQLCGAAEAAAVMMVLVNVSGRKRRRESSGLFVLCCLCFRRFDGSGEIEANGCGCQIAYRQIG